MKYLSIIIITVLSSSCYSDWVINCNSKDLSEMDNKICISRETAGFENIYNKLMKQLKTGLLKRIEEEKKDPASFNMSASRSLNNLKKSDELWRALSEIDCEIVVDSIGGGSAGPTVDNVCRAEQYKSRIKQLKGFSELWSIELDEK